MYFYLFVLLVDSTDKLIEHCLRTCPPFQENMFEFSCYLGLLLQATNEKGTIYHLILWYQGYGWQKLSDHELLKSLWNTESMFKYREELCAVDCVPDYVRICGFLEMPQKVKERDPNGLLRLIASWDPAPETWICSKQFVPHMLDHKNHYCAKMISNCVGCLVSRPFSLYKHQRLHIWACLSESRHAVKLTKVSSSSLQLSSVLMRGSFILWQSLTCTIQLWQQNLLFEPSCLQLAHPLWVFEVQNFVYACQEFFQYRNEVLRKKTHPFLKVTNPCPRVYRLTFKSVFVRCLKLFTHILFIYIECYTAE